MFELFSYSFIVRGLEAGLMIAILAPMIGMFLVLRRYSLIADTLAHVSLAGVALGVLFHLNPIITAITTSVVSSLGIERLRLSGKVYGESALSLFLSGSLALAVVLLGLANGFNVDLLGFLFGSIVTVQQSDLYTIAVVSLLVSVTIMLLYRQLVYVTFDEDAARISGLPTRSLNALLMILSSLTIAIAIPIIGVLLTSALIVIPVISALQFKRSFQQTLLLAEMLSITSVVAGIILSYYFNLATGGTIVLLNIGVFCLILLYKTRF